MNYCFQIIIRRKHIQKKNKKQKAFFKWQVCFKNQPGQSVNSVVFFFSSWKKSLNIKRCRYMEQFSFCVYVCIWSSSCELVHIKRILSCVKNMSRHFSLMLRATLASYAYHKKIIFTIK